MSSNKRPRPATSGNTPAWSNQYTERQGQFLAYIHQYSILNGCAPAEADMQRFFRVTPPTVHSMVLTLERHGFIRRVPGQARSISLIVPPEALPPLQRPQDHADTRVIKPARATHPKVSEKLLKIVEEIGNRGSASLTRLTVLKKWFERAERLSAFAIWMAAGASSRKGKTAGAAGEFFSEARRLLAGVNPMCPTLNRAAAESLHGRLRDFQSEYQNQQWGPVRIVHHWDLMLVEQGLAIWLWHANSPAHGYKLAADYCQHYDSRYGNGLNGPSAAKIEQIVRFMFTVEGQEDAIA